MIEKLKNIKDGRSVSESLRQEILAATSDMDNSVSIIERIHILVNGDQSICEYGNKKQFKNFKLGYFFCGKSCTCAMEKRNKTMTERYGVTNPIHSEEIREKRKQTMIDRYGCEYALQNKEIQEKMKENVIERFGVENPAQNIDVQEKTKKTLKERYGVEYTFQNKTIKEKAKRTLFDNYGVEHSLQNPDILKKHKKTMVERYGTEHALQNDTIQEQIRLNSNVLYNRNNSTQAHITDDGYAILQDEEEFKKTLELYSVSEIAQRFNVDKSSIFHYCEKYGIEMYSSSYETAICSFLKNNNIRYELHNRKIIKPLEIDILIEDYKIGIEFCGLYWHCERNIPDKKYHLSKLQKMKSLGYRLITIFEDEWLYNREIVEKMILNIIGLNEMNSDNLIVKEIPWEDGILFMNQYHIQHSRKSCFYVYGAYDNDALVAAMTFSSSNELEQFTTNGNNYPGIASRLLNAYIKDYNPKQIIGYADRRWCEDDLYKNLGFSKKEENEDVYYWYVKKDERYHRDMLFENCDKIYDCGVDIYVYNAIKL